MGLAPDPGAAKAGRELAAPRKWSVLGARAECLWGAVQGSGKAPYQVAADLTGPAFKCTCPSRKFPCKHSLGLLLIYVQQPAALTAVEPPGWVAEWLAKRREKAAPAAAPAVDAPPDPAAAAKAAAAAEKRVESREARVTRGLADLGVWLADVARLGLAALPDKKAAFWSEPAARLVDAQAPGLARRLGVLADWVAGGAADWPERLLRELAALHLVRSGWARRGELPTATVADLRTVIGFPVAQADLLTEPGVRDEWVVAGQRVITEGAVRTQRTWLFGTATGRAALSLSFSAAANQPLDLTLPIGRRLAAELVFYPGAWPQRALVKNRQDLPAGDVPPPLLPHPTIATARAAAAAAWAANPWLERVPIGVPAVVPTRSRGAWGVRDAAGHWLPLAVAEDRGWALLALSGGRPLALMGEWEQETLTPLGAWAEGRWVRW